MNKTTFFYLPYPKGTPRMEGETDRAGGESIATLQIEAVVDRLSEDRAFRVKYCQDPDQTLGSYHLSQEEIRAIKTGDDRLVELIGANKWEELIDALSGIHHRH